MKILFKFLLITSIIGLFIILYLPIKMFVNYWFDDLDFCLDTGVCQEGLPLNTEKGISGMLCCLLGSKLVYANIIV